MWRGTAALLVLTGAPVWSLSPAQKAGRDIYRRGIATGDPITIQMSGSGLTLPATRYPCVPCHGVRGEGAWEGGIRVPAIDRLALSSDRDVWNRPRPPYTELLLERAITSGLDTAGKPLHRAMPRFQMTRSQLGALLAYLRILNTDEDVEAGVTESSVRFGAALPLSGDGRRVGTSIRSRIERVFARVNQAGGVYGRRLELVTVDASLGPETMSRLVSQEPFALIANYELGTACELDEWARRENVPSIGPLDGSCGDKPNLRGYVFELLPSRAAQARMLALYLASAERWRRPVVIHPGSQQEKAAFGDSWGSLFAARLPYSRAKFSAEEAVAWIRQVGADAVLVLGAASDLKALTSSLGQEASPALAMESSNADWVAPAFERQLYTVSPTSEGELPLAAALSGIAAELAVEALKGAERWLSRPGFAQALKRIRHAGAGGSLTLPAGLKLDPGGYVVRVEPRSGRFFDVTGWLTPPK
jgi:hypothetical protein